MVLYEELTLKKLDNHKYKTVRTNEILAVLLLCFIRFISLANANQNRNKNKIMKIINKFMNEEYEDSNYEDLYMFFHDKTKFKAICFRPFKGL